jgi:DNA polymerase family A
LQTRIKVNLRSLFVEVWAEPNLQQVPRDWRTAFRVESPKLWLKGDLSQIEMVIIAVVTGDENLTKLLREGRDVYVEYDSRIFGRKAERGLGGDQLTNPLREVAKTITLGTSYGLTPFGFVRRIRDELGISFEIQEAQAFFETFFEMFPGIALYHVVAAEEALSLESVRTIGGTRRYLPPLVDDQSGDYWPSFERRKKILINTPIQGSGADLVVWAVNQFMPQLPAGVEIVNLVHDEVDAIVTEETLWPTVKTITRASVAPGVEIFKKEAVEAKAFFELARSHLQEGLFADPIYGGNRDKSGWRVLGHPGVWLENSAEENLSDKPVDKGGKIQSLADLDFSDRKRQPIPGFDPSTKVPILAPSIRRWRRGTTAELLSLRSNA